MIRPIWSRVVGIIDNNEEYADVFVYDLFAIDNDAIDDEITDAASAAAIAAGDIVDEFDDAVDAW